jgi:glutamate/tyrosine decarboxylase-like PLP-dependent enzyme
VQLPPEQMRALGYQVVDLLVERLNDPGIPALKRATAPEMAKRIAGPPPASPQEFGAVLQRLQDDVLPYMNRADHPRFFAFIPSCQTFPGALGDFIASALNVYVGSWMEAAGPSQVELTVIDWFKDWMGYPEQAAGLLVSGGSAANMTALACAREALIGAMSDRAVAYVSDQAHSSLARAARLLGFRPDQLRVLPAGTDLRLAPDALAHAIEADVAAGRAPLFASVSGGATNTGAIDPLDELADVCRDHGVWLHVDAAYGGFAALTDRGRAALHGIGRADSIALDPHKWLYQPMECGALLVREGHLLRRAFEIVPDYLKDAQVAEGEVNFSDLGLQLTRGWRALKVWLSIQTFGLDAFSHAIDSSLDLAAFAEQRVRRTPGLELMSPAQLGFVCFRRRFDGDEEEQAALNAALVARLEATGDAFVSSTRLHGAYAIRLCVLNHT